MTHFPSFPPNLANNPLFPIWWTRGRSNGQRRSKEEEMQCGDKKKYFFSFFNGNFSNTWKLFWELIYFAGKKCSDRKKATIMTEPFQDLLYPLAPVVRWERQGVVKKPNALSLKRPFPLSSSRANLEDSRNPPYRIQGRGKSRACIRRPSFARNWKGGKQIWETSTEVWLHLWIKSKGKRNQLISFVFILDGSFKWQKTYLLLIWSRKNENVFWSYAMRSQYFESS